MAVKCCFHFDHSLRACCKIQFAAVTLYRICGDVLVLLAGIVFLKVLK